MILVLNKPTRQHEIGGVEKNNSLWAYRHVEGGTNGKEKTVTGSTPTSWHFHGLVMIHNMRTRPRESELKRNAHLFLPVSDDDAKPRMGSRRGRDLRSFA
ncbi:hypothetical protein Droror1_Dr00024599 [Drosera rotundifolia]